MCKRSSPCDRLRTPWSLTCSMRSLVSKCGPRPTHQYLYRSCDWEWESGNIQIPSVMTLSCCGRKWIPTQHKIMPNVICTEITIIHMKHYHIMIYLFEAPIDARIIKRVKWA